MKRCPVCGTDKSEDQFHTDRRRKDGLKRECKQCKAEADAAKYSPAKRRTDYMRTRYGLAISDYHRMLDAQRGRCAICGTDNPGRVSYKKFCIDHCHITGAVRGLLCHQCNTSLGGFRDNPQILSAAISYLQKHNESTAHRLPNSLPADLSS